jgi:Zn-dependent alcohol dehydrogenase
MMKAAVCYELGKPLVIDEVEIDEPHRGEVRVRTAAAAICHSDIHLIRGDWGDRTPVIAGHEAAGVVERVGEGVTSTKPGDRVVVSLLRSCGRCFYCTIGSPHLCEGDFALKRESRLRNARGEKINHGINTAAFAEQVVVHHSQVAQVPDEVPLDRAALLACGVITGFGAVVNTACVTPGSSVVVIGIGGVGLNAVQGAALSGAHPIVAVDLLESKLKAAQAFGATHGINAEPREAAVDLVKQLTCGRGADYVFVAVGSCEAAALGLGLIRRQGTMVLVGIPASEARVPLPVLQHVVGEWRILGSLMGSTRLSVFIPRLVQLYLGGRLKLDELITARYPLDDISKAIESTESGEALRNVILFSQE